MDRRITLVNSLDQTHDWRVDTDSNSRIVFAASFKVLRYALEDAIRMFTHDVERVIVDRTATASDFLDILAHIPEQFVGDVLYVREDETAYLSAIGRGGDRVLYALTERDVCFYLQTHGLIAMPSVAAA